MIRKVKLLAWNERLRSRNRRFTNNKAREYVLNYESKLDKGFFLTEDCACLCGSKSCLLVSELCHDGFRARNLLCTACGLIYQSPHLAGDSLVKYYQNEFRAPYTRGGSRSLSEKFASMKHRTGPRIYGKLLRQVGRFKDFRVLEIGCGVGGICAYFKDEGCEVIGLEIDSEAAEYGRQQGIDIRIGGIDELPSLFKEKVFDLVI